MHDAIDPNADDFWFWGKLVRVTAVGAGGLVAIVDLAGFDVASLQVVLQKAGIEIENCLADLT